MRKISKKKAILFAVTIVFIFLTIIAFLNVGSWLKGTDSPERSSAIIVLSGPPTRSFHAAELYRQGYAGAIYVTRPIREGSLEMLDELNIYFPRTEKMHTDVLLKKGVPKERIHLVGDACLSTVDEAEVVSRLFRGEDCRVLVVTSPYHVKRTQMIFRDKMKECKFKVLATPYESFPKKWWKDQDSSRNVILEIIKIIFYKFGGRFETLDEK